MCHRSGQLSCLLKAAGPPRASKTNVRTKNVPIKNVPTDELLTGYRAATHCIFDMDGLLLDDEAKCEEIISEIVKKFNKTLPRETRYSILGTNEEHTADLVVAELQLPLTTKEFLERYRALSTEKMSECSLMKGAERLIRHLHTNNIPIALVTCSSEPLFELKTKKHRAIFDLFKHVAFGSLDIEVVKGKVQPNIYLKAAASFQDKPDPEKCLVFEDSPNGIRTARAAGMQCVMVPVAGLPKEMCQDATVVIESLEDFRPELFGLPAINVNPEPDTH